MIAVPIAAGIGGIVGKLTYDELKRQPVKQQFALQNVNAPALYFPSTVTFDGKIEIFDLKAVDPQLNDTNSSVENTETTEPKKSKEISPKQHFKSLSQKGIQWFNKMKEDAIQKIDEAKKEFDKNKKEKDSAQNDENNDDGDDNDSSDEEAPLLFSDNLHLQTQDGIPSYFEPYAVDCDENNIKTAKDINAFISSNISLEYKWKTCSVLMHEHCLYIKLDDEWKYLSFYNDNLQFIPLTISNPHNLSFFYWTDASNNYVIARCPNNENVDEQKQIDGKQSEANVNDFIRAYIANKNDIIEKGLDQREHIRKLWIIYENIHRAKDVILDLSGNIAAIYHWNEFELDLKLLIRSEPDLRADFWGKFEDTEYCAMTDCDVKFGTFRRGTFQRKHHCYLCGKVICDKCGRNEFKNPIYNDLEQRACNQCFSVYYPKMKEENNIFKLPLDTLLMEYNERKENQFEFTENERFMIKESVLLCNWIYDGAVLDPQLIEILGFKQHKVVLYGQENQTVQYAIVESLQHKDTMYLVFRGSYDLMDWMTNFQSNPLKTQEIGFRVHSGMYCALQQHVLDVMIHDLCINNIIPHNKRLVICGHSLGGGYAVLSATCLLAHHKQLKYYFNQHNLKVITFGGPLVLEKGVGKSTEIGKLLHEITINFINQFDVVPRIGEGLSLEYIKKITEKSIDDSMKKVWGLKHVDNILNLKIQEKIQLHLFERDDIKNMDKVQQEIYGAIGAYYLLMSKRKPREVIKYGKKKSVYVRQLDGECLFMPDAEKLLSLLPKRSGLFANHMLFDHFMSGYMTALYYMDK